MLRSAIPRCLVLFAALVVASGCSGSPACEPEPREIELAVPAQPDAPPLPPVCRGSEVTLTVTASADGVVHVHGYDAEAPATPVIEGEALDISFTAGQSGQFVIEFHTAERPEGVTVGILTVNEP